MGSKGAVGCASVQSLQWLSSRNAWRCVVFTTVMTPRKSAMFQNFLQRLGPANTLPTGHASPVIHAVRMATRLVLATTLATTAVVPLAAHAQAQTYAQRLNADNAAEDAPSQVARVNFIEGSVSVLTASAGEPGTRAQTWTAADLNRPLTSGDRVLTDRGARAELHVGSTAIRLDGLSGFSGLSGLTGVSNLELQRLDDSALLLRLGEGSVILRVRTLFDGQRMEVSTPNLGFAVTQPGDYRLDVNLATDTTRVVAQTGGGVIYGERTAPLTISAQQQGSFSGTALTQAPPGAALQDSFDAWAGARDRAEDQSTAARYVPREVVGYQQLDTHGDWTQDVTYGAVWLPRVVPANWAPYRVGQWRWIAPWGWTWVDDAPWGFAPFHYGRWAQIGPRWGWVPGRLAPRPVYAPALVGFIGGPGGGAGQWNVAPGLGGGARPGLGWFPLAPGEAYRPAYRASPRYLTQVNHNIVVNNVHISDGYRFQRQGGAVTAAAAEEFARGRVVRGRASGLSADELARAPLMNNRFDGMPSFRGGALPNAANPRFVDGPGARNAGLPSTGLPGSPGSLPAARSPGNTGNPQPSTAVPQTGRQSTVPPAAGLAPPPQIQPGRPIERGPVGNRPEETLLEADIRARRDQQRLQFEQQRSQDHLARQQEAQRQRDQASIGERAMRMQQEQAQRSSQQLQQQQDAQRLEFQRAQQQQLQSQQQRIQAQQQEAMGQRALREQAERQRQSDERVRAQQNQRPSREAPSNDPASAGNPRTNEKRGFNRPE